MKEVKPNIPITSEELVEATDNFLIRLRKGAEDPNQIVGAAFQRLLTLYNDPAQLEKEVTAQLRINPLQLLGRPLGARSASDKLENNTSKIFPDVDQSEIIGLVELQILAELDEENDVAWVREQYEKSIGEEM